MCIDRKQEAQDALRDMESQLKNLLDESDLSEELTSRFDSVKGREIKVYLSRKDLISEQAKKEGAAPPTPSNTNYAKQIDILPSGAKLTGSESGSPIIVNTPRTGIAMSDGCVYYIFIDKYYAEMCYPGLGGTSILFTLYHEFGHVLHGDVLFDYANDYLHCLQTVKIKRLCLDPESEERTSEQCADGYAYCRLRKELSSLTEQLESLEDIRKKKGINGCPFILPSDQEYKSRYP